MTGDPMTAASGIELLQIEQEVGFSEQMRYGDEPSFFRHLVNQAAHALSQRIMETCSVYRRIDPKKDELVVRHRWTVGVQRNKQHILSMEAQLEAARRQGMRDAADLLQEGVAVYDHVSGMCAHVLRHQLSESVRKIRKAANSEPGSPVVTPTSNAE